MKLNKQAPLGRGAGILLPIFSLPSPHGIGTLGKDAYRFLDFLSAAGQKYWQVLPIGPTTYGDSPYQSLSAFAGNPYFIDLDFLASDGLLTGEDFAAADFGSDPARVDYSLLYTSRFAILRKAFARDSLKSAAYRRFRTKNAAWLEDYALFMALKGKFGGRSWQDWPEEYRFRDENALNAARQELDGEMSFWRWCQFRFFSQWNALHDYAKSKKIQIIGDIPIYVALDSCDVWANSSMFQLDEQRRPRAVAGVPPDLFSATGQLWGNPLYDWDRMKEDGFSWWKARIASCAALYDVIRIDHFIGLVNYCTIPAGEPTAVNGRWVPGPGEALLAAIQSSLHGSKIIAEDLGVVTPAVRELLAKSGYPGMCVLSFAFDGSADNTNLPIHYIKNCVCYGGTHDNEPLQAMFSHASPQALEFARDYLNIRRNSAIPDAVVRAGYASCADTVIFTIQDLMGLGAESRLNAPSTSGQNWKWRLLPRQIPASLSRRLQKLVRVYGR